MYVQHMCNKPRSSGDLQDHAQLKFSWGYTSMNTLHAFNRYHKECMGSLYRVCHDAQEEVKSEEREKHGEDLVDLNC